MYLMKFKEVLICLVLEIFPKGIQISLKLVKEETLDRYPIEKRVIVRILSLPKVLIILRIYHKHKST